MSSPESSKSKPVRDETLGAHAAEVHDDSHHAPEERQPDSNASAPQNFSPHYNPTQNYAPRSSAVVAIAAARITAAAEIVVVTAAATVAVAGVGAAVADANVAAGARRARA